ncbi:hypothetical protein RAA17_11190 [Komagataeibacter rhaeticus]|nr:hypothetical protein [Komagataeibacter rhaeticus]
MPASSRWRARGEHARAQAWQDHARALATALEATWDGDWYLRAYFDDGTPLGAHTSAECQIDAISQSWAVLSGVAPLERAEHAMRSVMARLVRGQDGLVLVLAPVQHHWPRSRLHTGLPAGHT